MDEEFNDFIEKQIKEKDLTSSKTRKELVLKLSEIFAEKAFPLVQLLDITKSQLSTELFNQLLMRTLVSLMLATCDNFDDAVNICNMIKEEVVKVESEFNKS